MSEPESAEGTDAEAEATEEAQGSRIPPLILIPLLIVLLGLALYIGANVLGVLFAVIAPPSPPLPPNMTQIEHTSEAYGVDDWKYTTTTDACEVVKSIEQNDGVCLLMPLQCADAQATTGDFQINDSLVARCGGKVAFSIFNMQWWAHVTRNSDTETQLELHREVYWIGTGPQ